MVKRYLVIEIRGSMKTSYNGKKLISDRRPRLKNVLA